MIKPKYKVFYKKYIEKLWQEIEPEINKRFIEGLATCAYASLTVSKYLEQLEIHHEVGEGWYKGYFHWFVVTDDDIIIDLGNNIEETHGDNLKIEPFITDLGDKNYKVDKFWYARNYYNYYRINKIERY